MEDELDLGEIPNLPIDIDVPLKHEKPKTTLESLVQVKNEFTTKIQEAAAKNDTSKKRRYERQLKQFEDAIKATKEGKVFDYTSLVVPPGFSSIPLNNGKPILDSEVSTRPASNRVSNVKVEKVVHKPTEEEELSDDILEQLENEIDENDLMNDPELADPEDEKINQMLKAASIGVPGLNLGKLPKEMDLDSFENELEAFKIPQAKPSNRQSKLTAIEDPEPVITRQTNPVPRPAPIPPKSTVSPNQKKQNKELQIVIERQRLFREAALKAKQDGNTKVALIYLKHAKGFDSMIIAAENGLPLDMSNLPVPPQLENRQKTSSSNLTASAASGPINLRIDDIEPISGDRKAVFKRLQEDLLEQIKVATANFKHFTNMGDINSANKFNLMARESIRDLDALKSAFEHGKPVPLYHYERRTYQTVDCNSDLTDNDLELTIIRAINLPLPKDFEAKHMNTYVKFEFPYPTEAVQTDKTNKQSGTLNPEYNQMFKLQIQRKQSKFLRLINRKELKLEIYYKAGLLKGDKLLATCLVKLQPLENNSTIHDAYDLLEGRKQLGGKLELKIRIREPLLHKEVKILEQKWLIIDDPQSTNTVSL